jgi:DNA mismatch repair protein MutH
VERTEAVKLLKKIEGKDLVKLAHEFGITVWKDGKINKGWAGHTLERYLGLPLNSAQAPNFGSWELKIVPLKRLRDGTLAVKETMAITMIDAVNVEDKPFAESHLLAKLRKAVVCARIFESKDERHSILYKVATFDLTTKSLLEGVKEDYEDVRATIRRSGFKALSGHMGTLVQPRTKGAGHGSTSRAFYARTAFVKLILGL